MSLYHVQVDPKRFILDPSPSQVQELIEGMTLPHEMVLAIEENTRKQTDSTLWLALHNGRLTSSRFGEILRRKEDTNPAVLVKSIMGYQKKFVSTPAMKWGRDNEEKARRKYIQEREAVGEKMSVRETGLTLCPTMSYIGASADGYVTCHSVDTCCCGA